MTAVFLHAGLSHAAANVGFLLLIGRWAERLVGPVAFLGTFLFAGACGTLLSVGWFPFTPAVGASGGVYGAYGLLAGAWARGWRRIPPAFVGRLAAGAAVMLAAQLTVDGLTRGESQVAHAGGLAAGVGAGLVTGLSDRLRAHRTARPAVRFAVRSLTAALFVFVCGGLAAWGALPPLGLRQPLEPAVDRERPLLARLDRLLERWADRTIDDREAAAELRREHLPAWARFAAEHRLERLAARLSPNDSAVLVLRRLPLRSPTSPEPPPTTEDLREALALITAARIEALTALAFGLEGSGTTTQHWTDLLTVELFRRAADDTANEGNRLQQLVGFSRGERPPAAGRRAPPR